MSQLYPFQSEAVVKLLRVRHALIGDDMGLGKTVTAIELDRQRRRSEAYHNKRQHMQTLVVTLKSTVGAWAEHFAEWNPTARVVVCDAKNRAAFVHAAKHHTADVFICHWEVTRLEPELARVKWFHIVADETQKMKNRKAQLTQAFKKLPAEYRTAMSGTWVDNAPQDAWSTLNWLYPQTWSSYWQFYNRHVVQVTHTSGFCLACSKQHKNAFREIVGVAEVDALRDQMSRFYVRRTKEEVLDDLPEKYWSTVTVQLEPKQRRAYEEMRKYMVAWVGVHQNEPVAAPVVIAQLTRLQQFAIAYGELEEFKKKVKVPINEAYLAKHPEFRMSFEVDADGNMFFRREETYQRLVLTDPSSKLDALMEIIEGQNGPFVVFCQRRQPLDLLKQRMIKAKISHAMITGDQTGPQRTQIVNDFQAGKHTVLAGTIKAGGTGLTLTRASTVIFIDRDWSPSANRQAEDRLHRIGQRSAVHVIDIVAADTIDAGRMQKINLKWEWIRQMLGDK